MHGMPCFSRTKLPRSGWVSKSRVDRSRMGGTFPAQERYDERCLGIKTVAKLSLSRPMKHAETSPQIHDENYATSIPCTSTQAGRQTDRERRSECRVMNALSRKSGDLIDGYKTLGAWLTPRPAP